MKWSTQIKTAAALGGFVLATSAFANDGYSVSYKSSEMNSIDGVGEVHARIVDAAKEYCQSFRKSGAMRGGAACIEDVTNDLVEKISHPRLVSYHNNETGLEVAIVAKPEVSDPS